MYSFHAADIVIKWKKIWGLERELTCQKNARKPKPRIEEGLIISPRFKKPPVICDPDVVVLRQRQNDFDN